MNNKDRSNLYPDNQENSILKEGMFWKVLGIIFGLFLIYKLLFMGKSGMVTSLGLSILPIAFVGFLSILKFYRRIFYLLFSSHFILLIASAFVDLKIGAITFVFNSFVITLLLLISLYRNTSWKNGFNGMLLLYLIWSIYCLAELANPNAVQEAWNIAITHYVGYPIICAILVPLTIGRYKNIEWLFIIWSVFILIATFKGYWQKNQGFSVREMIFLYEGGGARTHIIWSGIRYFSVFTDAANYGVHMAMAALGFGISIFTVKNKWLKLYFCIIVLAAIYGMAISGTRSALAVPIGGLFLFIFISRNFKAFFIGLFALIAIFGFFRLTTIGNSNEYVKKMRSAFNPTEDASYQVRVANREKIKEYMSQKPFGYGLGLGAKADRFHPRELMPIASDSWLVNVWADTGIIGFTIYLIIHFILFAWCSWILMFKVMNKDLRNLITAFLCVNAGFFIAAYANDVMQYPNMIIVYTGFALCFAAPSIDKRERPNIVKPKNKTISI